MTWSLFGSLETIGGGNGTLHRAAGELEYWKCLVFLMNTIYELQEEWVWCELEWWDGVSRRRGNGRPFLRRGRIWIGKEQKEECSSSENPTCRGPKGEWAGFWRREGWFNSCGDPLGRTQTRTKLRWARHAREGNHKTAQKFYRVPKAGAHDVKQLHDPKPGGLMSLSSSQSQKAEWW